VAFPQKGALKEGTTIVFCDQWGFYLLLLGWLVPTLRLERGPSSRSISAEITSQLRAPSPLRRQALHETEQERSFKGEDVVGFLKYLMRRIEGKLLLIWDGSSIHRGGAVKDFVSSGASRGLKLEQLPFSMHLI
jgi:hypothetical protein